MSHEKAAIGLRWISLVGAVNFRWIRRTARIQARSVCESIGHPRTRAHQMRHKLSAPTRRAPFVLSYVEVQVQPYGLSHRKLRCLPGASFSDKFPQRGDLGLPLFCGVFSQARPVKHPHESTTSPGNPWLSEYALGEAVSCHGPLQLALRETARTMLPLNLLDGRSNLQATASGQPLTTYYRRP